MEPTTKRYDFRLSGKGTGDTHCHLSRFATGGQEANHFTRGDQLLDKPRPLNPELRLATGVKAALRLLLDRLNDMRVCVA
jgi:hypothetical protein